MSLSITINNINDLNDTERAVLRLIVGDKQVTLTGPTATRQFIESIAGDEDVPPQTVREVTVPKLVVEEEATPAPAPAAPIPASAELDSAGLPWDKRIHSSSRARLDDGTWRKLRGVDKSLVATVEAELRAVQNLRVPLPSDGSTVVADVPPNTTSITVERDPATVVQHEDGVIPVPVPNPTNSVVNPITGETLTEGELLMTAPSVPVPPVPTPTLAEMQAKLAAAEELPPHPVPVPPVPTAMTFADLMRKHVTPRLLDGKLTQDTLIAVAGEFGLPHLAALGARPDLVEAVRARIDEVCNGAA